MTKQDLMWSPPNKLLKQIAPTDGAPAEQWS